MATKTFASGDVLTAADTNTYLANSGYQYIAGASFSNVASFDVTGFSSDFILYKLTIRYNTHAPGTATCSAQIRLGGSPYGSQYYGGSVYANYLGATGVFASRNNGTNIPIPGVAYSPSGHVDFTIGGPSNQTFSLSYIGYDTRSSQMVTGGFSNYSATNTFDEIRIFGTANITGAWVLSGVRT